MWSTERPVPGEHHEYYGTYIGQVPDEDVLACLRTSLEETLKPLSGAQESTGDYRYAPGKWSVREFLTHLIDVERTFAFRAFWFARNGAGELPSLEQEDVMAASGAASRTLASLIDEWRAVRAATVALFDSFDNEAARRAGVASGRPFTARACAWIIAGHERHHRQHLAPPRS